MDQTGARKKTLFFPTQPCPLFHTYTPFPSGHDPRLWNYFSTWCTYLSGPAPRISPVNFQHCAHANSTSAWRRAAGLRDLNTWGEQSCVKPAKGSKKRICSLTCITGSCDKKQDYVLYSWFIDSERTPRPLEGQVRMLQKGFLYSMWSLTSSRTSETPNWTHRKTWQSRTEAQYQILGF